MEQGAKAVTRLFHKPVPPRSGTGFLFHGEPGQNKKEINKMKRNWLTVVAGALLLGAGLGVGGQVLAEDVTPPTSVEERLNALEQKQKIQERRWEIDQEIAAAKAKDAIIPVAGKDGFALKSTDGSFQIKFAGDVQTDGRFYLNDKKEAFTDAFLLRRVRPQIDLSVYGAFDARIQPNFGGGATSLDDAYLEYRAFPAAKLRVGRFKSPVGLESLQSSSKITFIERGLPTALVPSYDEGVQLHGDLWKGAASYAVAVLNGTTDGTNTDTDNNDRKDFAARLFLTPFKSAASNLVNDLGFGIGAITGKDFGTTNASTTRLPSYRTEGQNSFFSYRGTTIASGTRTRWSPQLSWYPGRVGVLAEYVVSAQDVKSTSTLATADLKNKAWQVAVSYVLTGERTSYKGIKPRKPFDLKQKTWGAIEVAGRYSQIVIDRNAFTRFVDITRSPRVARAWTGGLNWYLNPVVKVASNYTYTWFDRGATAGNRDAERALFTRFQFSY